MATLALTALTALGSDPLPPCWRGDTNTTLQAWRFDSSTLPASPEVVTSPGSPTASTTLGIGAGGWVNTLFIFGTNQGIWDLGPAGTMTLNVPNHPAPTNSWKYVSVQVTEYRDGLYKSNVTVSLPGAVLVSTQSVDVASTPFGGGKWVVNQSLWLIAPCPTNETITLTAASSGAAIDEVVVDTQCSTGDDGDLFPPCWRAQAGTTWQDWSFHASPNPSSPERGNNLGASATAVVGSGGTGWRDRLSAVGCRQGFWDLGNSGSLTMTIPNTSGSGTSYKYVRVQAVMYQDSLVYTIPATVTVPGATQIGGEQTSVVDTGTLGQWIVRQTVWRLAPCPASEQVVITAPSAPGKGALVDQVIVDTLCLDWPVPSNQTVNTAVGICQSGPVTWTLPTPDGCKLLAASSAQASGTTFPKGTNSVTVTYTDAESQAYVTNFTVVVLDNQAPVASCPADIVTTNDGVNCGAIVTFTATASDNCPGATVACIPPSGSVFPLGSTTVTCTATDASGNVSAPCSFTVTVLDTTGDVAAPCWRGEPNSTFQHWTFGTSANPVTPEFVSNISPPMATVTTGPGSTGWKSSNVAVYGCRQGFWDLGRYGTMSLNITNVGGTVQSYKYVRVQVVQYRDSLVFTSNAVVSIAGATQVGVAQQVTNSITTLGYWISEETLWLIEPCPTTETVVVTGGYYGALIDQVVVDTLCTEPPACPPSLNLVADLGFCSKTNVTWASPAVDGCVVKAVSYSPPSGSTFPVGITTVTQSVTDAESQIQVCTFTVTVSDTQPPVAIGQNITVPLDALGNATISPSQVDGGSTDNCGIASLSISQTNFTCANLGPNNVTLTVTDVHGLTSSSNAQVTIVDATPPQITCPADIHVGECNALVSFAATATDNCSVTNAYNIGGTPITSPHAFPVGTNIVQAVATDAGGNTATCSFTVTVDPLPVVASATVQATVGATNGPVWPVNSSYPNFSMCIDPLSSDYYLDLATLNSSVALQPGVLNGFKLDTNSLPASWLSYWAAKGVDGVNNANGWELQMWQIINGNAPFFYIKLSGSDYLLVDGLQYSLLGGEPILRVPGDYPQHNYRYSGTVQDVNGCVSSFFDVFFQFNTVPAPTIAGSASVCAGSVAIYSTESGQSGYTWTVVGGTGSSTTDSITVTWGAAGPGSVSVNYNNAGGCTAAAATTLPVTINANPAPTITGSDQVCPGSVAVYSTESGMSGYTWVVSGGTGSSTTDSITVTWGSGPAGSVSVNYVNGSGCTASAPALKNVAIVATADLAVEISAAPTTLYVGETLTYTITVSNGGPCTATGMVLSNSLTAGQIGFMLTNGTNLGVACLFDGPVAWWPAEGDASDAVGTNDGASAGGTTFAAGVVGQAFSFDGTNDSVSVPDAPELRPSSLTLEGWIKIQDVSGVHVIAGKRLGAGTLDSYAMWIESGVLYAGIAGTAGAGATLSYPEFPSYSQFRMGDLLDLLSFATKLQAGADPVSQFITNNLSVPTLALLTAYSGGTNDELHEALIGELNILIGNGSVYESNRFAGVTLSSESQYMLGRNPSGEDLVRLNRYLIRDAYPAEFQSNIFPQLNQWFHVAYSIDAAGDVQALYVNGQLVDTGFETNSIAYDSHPLLIGADDDNGSPGYFYRGLIDELSIYDRALTGTEIRAIHDAGIAGKCPDPGVVALGTLGANDALQVVILSTPTNCGTMSAAATITSVGVDPNLANNSGTGMSTAVELPTSLWVLEIERVSSNVGYLRINWPVLCSTSQLEAASSLQPPVIWSPITVPVQIIDNQQSTLVTPTNSMRYFRLRTP